MSSLSFFKKFRRKTEPEPEASTSTLQTVITRVDSLSSGVGSGSTMLDSAILDTNSATHATEPTVIETGVYAIQRVHYYNHRVVHVVLDEDGQTLVLGTIARYGKMPRSALYFITRYANGSHTIQTVRRNRAYASCTGEESGAMCPIVTQKAPCHWMLEESSSFAGLFTIRPCDGKLPVSSKSNYPEQRMGWGVASSEMGTPTKVRLTSTRLLCDPSCTMTIRRGGLKLTMEKYRRSL
ncbi:hypothetical protein BD410DRAFT_549704 [Rickenella mellea]|uniref:Uncharacterized protein n=1 Tax=Rickenella mellea TaxID=50990 RepID=A0A4Y7PSE4_9AGAM|nr:hypothetical protein BD410DRAFT_549704 [Rickenella mellea]